MPNPTVTITITGFSANSANQPGTPYCTIGSVALSNVQGDADVDQIGFLPNSTTNIWVKSPDLTGGPGSTPLPVPIDIVIVSSPPAAPATQFNLTVDSTKKIRFSKTTNGGDSNGNANFPRATVSGATVSISDKCKDHGSHANGTAPAWKYSIAVNDSVSGSAGWIDPTMENADDL